jgi:hypothetical protein
MEWCMTLFTKRLALGERPRSAAQRALPSARARPPARPPAVTARADVVGRVWDCYLIFGEVFVYRTAVGACFRAPRTSRCEGRRRRRRRRHSEVPGAAPQVLRL